MTYYCELCVCIIKRVLVIERNDCKFIIATINWKIEYITNELEFKIFQNEMIVEFIPWK